MSLSELKSHRYCESLTSYQRRKTKVVNIGGLLLGGNNPIRVQSMTTVDTMDTKGSIEQTIRMIESGCELVRITAPSLKEAQNLDLIKKGLRAQGYDVPLVADIHFTPNAAELAARIVEKVRINPGNYADKKKFDIIEYTDQQYEDELYRIRERFLPLIKICKEHGTAMRIGTNHGSLSDRIMSRYGDTPNGMVESALEFLKICEDENYHDIVISMKSSNTQVMVQAYRLLVNRLDNEGYQPYPLHLGVTEAGEGEDGRIKSAVGIGTLLEDGLGDTVRVSLTEEPEFEAPVARTLVDRYVGIKEIQQPLVINEYPINPFEYKKRETRGVVNIGSTELPRVIADLSHRPEITPASLFSVGYQYAVPLDKWSITDLACDYVYAGMTSIDFPIPGTLGIINDYEAWKASEAVERRFPLLSVADYENCNGEKHPNLNFLKLEVDKVDEKLLYDIASDHTIVIVATSDRTNSMKSVRNLFVQLIQKGIKTPVIINHHYHSISPEALQIHAATEVGALLIDGLGEGVMLSATNCGGDQVVNTTAFGILQAARTRMTKTEYISCPSCGRTLFDLQETTAMIRKRTDHLKGVKIGIMGCIVNGPGEMADADYGYVGSGKGKITLYKGQEVIKRSVPSENAVDELIEIIKSDGQWIEPKSLLETT